MDLLAIRQQLDVERRTLIRPDERVEILPHVTRVQRDTQHEISFSNLTADNADAVIAEQVRHYRRLNVEVEWKVFAHDQPADLLQRVVAHGFQQGPAEAVLALDLRDAPDWVFDRSGPA